MREADAGGPQFECGQPRDDDGILAAPATDRIRADRGQFGRRPVGQCPQRQQLLTGRRWRPGRSPSICAGRTAHRRNSHGTVTARIGGAATASASSHASQLAVVSRSCPAPAMSRAASLAAVSGLLDCVAQQRKLLRAMPGRSQVARDAFRAAFDLPAGFGDRRDGVVHGQTDEHPYRRPQRDGDIADQLAEQPNGPGGVGQVPRHTPIPAQLAAEWCGWPDRLTRCAPHCPITSIWPAARSVRSTASTTSTCCWSPRTGSRRTTMFWTAPSRTRAAS